LKLIVALLCSVLVAIVGCKNWAMQKKPTTEINSCDLLKTSEIEAIQGSPATEAKDTVHFEAGFRVSQCLYVTAEQSKSVVLTVWQSDPSKPTGRSPKDFWKEKFGRFGQDEKGEARRQAERGEEVEGKSNPPLKIEGVGDEAYWVPSIAAALYVLKGDLFIRIGLGRLENEEVRRKKSKELAEKALARL
jgi:hypothetical protein